MNREDKISEVLKNCLRNKFRAYKPETTSMPFHTRLLGKDRIALYSFIHSLSTSFGMSIFEPVAKELAIGNFKEATTQQTVGKFISSEAEKLISQIIRDLESADKEPDQEKEIELLRKVCQKGEKIKAKANKADIKLIGKNDEIYLVDLKSPKPNSTEFAGFKRMLLNWIAMVLLDNPSANINVSVAMPYNPYDPEPYNRWTMKGMLDLKKDIKIAEDFWDFLGGKGSYQMLLGIFEKVGMEMRVEIDNHFKKFV